MKERPILFSAPMVRAILEGRKTQTRRIVKNIDPAIAATADGFISPPRCPYGNPGDRLWVRETWGVGTRPDPVEGWRDGIEYRADEAWLDEFDDFPLYQVSIPENIDLDDYRGVWKPSIHMPRWASRITLEITGVRVERLKDISEADALAEGVTQEQITTTIKRTAYSEFMHLWESINGWDSWESNPWVWVIEFKRLDAEQL